MSISKQVASDLDDLPLDVFELAGSALTVESLTADHGMTEAEARTSRALRSLCCLTNPPKHH